MKDRVIRIVIRWTATIRFWTLVVYKERVLSIRAPPQTVRQKRVSDVIVAAAF